VTVADDLPPVSGRQSLSSDCNGVQVLKRQNPHQSKGFVADRRQLSSTGKVEAAGIEPEAPIFESPTEQQLTESTEQISALCLHDHGTSCHPQASIDAILAPVVELWPSLPPEKQCAIYAVCIDSALLDE
jgi:hypothetical protein